MLNCSRHRKYLQVREAVHANGHECHPDFFSNWVRFSISAPLTALPPFPSLTDNTTLAVLAIVEPFSPIGTLWKSTNHFELNVLHCNVYVITVFMAVAQSFLLNSRCATFRENKENNRGVMSHRFFVSLNEFFVPNWKNIWQSLCPRVRNLCLKS